MIKRVLCELDAEVDRINDDPERRAEVAGFLTSEMSINARERVARKEDEAEGEACMDELIGKLLSTGCSGDLERVVADVAYRNSLMRELGIS